LDYTHVSVHVDRTRGLADLTVRGPRAAGPDDHRLTAEVVSILFIEGNTLVDREVAALTALNVDLRNEYIADCGNGVRRRNGILADHGIDVTLALPNVGFNRAVGTFAGHRITPKAGSSRSAGGMPRPTATCRRPRTRPTSSR
jgi:benzoyl-CoA 2,3-dioxygenase component B